MGYLPCSSFQLYFGLSFAFGKTYLYSNSVHSSIELSINYCISSMPTISIIIPHLDFQPTARTA